MKNEDQEKIDRDLEARMKRLFPVIAAAAALAPVAQIREGGIPNGWECNVCGARLSHEAACLPPRSLRKVQG